MPADRGAYLFPGRRGLNLRDHPSALNPEELADTNNFHIGRRGELEKRQGYTDFGQAPAAILEADVFAPSGQTAMLVVHCADGQTYKTTDGVTFTAFGSVISTTQRASFAQYLDELYWCDGTNDMQSYDGTTAATLATAPRGRFLSVWRNRLWVAGLSGADSRKFYWSKLGDASDWTNTFNFNTIADGTEITALATMPNPGGGTLAGDGLLVFTQDRTYRVLEDADNANGVTIGGGFQLVDPSTGCYSHRSLVPIRGRLYFLARDGVYSTDGSGRNRLESALLSPIFNGGLALGQAENACAVDWQGRYLLSVTPTGQTSNTRVLELYPELPANDEGQHPWMVHDLPVAAWGRYPAPDELRLYFADTVSTDRIRRAFQGGADLQGASSPADIACSAKTGGQLFALSQLKRIRRVEIWGAGLVNLAISSDFEAGVGEGALFDMAADTDYWSTDDVWGEGSWGPTTGSVSAAAYYTKSGRYLTFEFSERSQRIASLPSPLGLAAVAAGGASVRAVHVTVTPLDTVSGT